MRVLTMVGTGATVALVASTAALAHTGAQHSASFASGFMHPWSGLDHALAMVAVGLWAGLNGGRAAWAWPAAFVGVMVIGGGLAMSSIPLPAVEAGILASLIVLGLLVLLAAQFPVAAGANLVGGFALLHGYAHGAELPATAAALSYAAGFAVATALLHIVGLVVAKGAVGRHRRLAIRGAGALLAAGGVALALS
jgi:urease accessory protein